MSEGEILQEVRRTIAHGRFLAYCLYEECAQTAETLEVRLVEILTFIEIRIADLERIAKYKRKYDGAGARPRLLRLEKATHESSVA